MADTQPTPSTPIDIDASGGSQRPVPVLNEVLLREKLLSATDDTIIPGEAITPAALVLAAEELLAREGILTDLMPSANDRRQFTHLLGGLQLSDRIVTKLTVAARDRPELLSHSLRVAFCAAAVAQRLRMARHEVAEAIAAGIFHDLGTLLVDPELLQSGRRLDERERHYLDAHPFAGYLMLEDESAWHPVVSTAVLEHHERTDGSGYPRGIGGSRLGQLGQLLGVAELAATLLVPTGNTALCWLRLGVVLRLNEEKLNREFVSCLLQAFPVTGIPKADHQDLSAAIEVLLSLAIAFQGWKTVRAAQAALPMAVFIENRMDRLGRNLADVGIDLEYWLELDAEIERDPHSLNEIKLASREGLRQLRDIADEARRRWAKLQPTTPDVVAWIERVEALQR
jgi:hypothetical protein